MNLKNKLKNNENNVGTWMQIGHPAISEILSHKEYDWIGIDLEHGEVEISDLPNIFRSFNKDCCHLVRVSQNDNIEIRKVLDYGADGVIVPLIESKYDVKKAIDSCNYPPKGNRGTAFHRANSWGENFNSYSLKDVIVIAMIETKKGVDNIEEILSIKDLDGILIGNYDLSASYNMPGDFEKDEFIDIINYIYKKCNEYNKSFGSHIVRPNNKDINNLKKANGNIFCLGIDTVFINTNSTHDYIYKLNSKVI